ncbi:thioredoxin family protein [Streptococcus orisasini]|uniref:thioredoxin family protein n=1 Tax=Streptococcus orisasini TaxID=1080071 RepID=UPI0007090DD2|nr:thioredoxin family protein [Streptococcus orisasini]
MNRYKSLILFSATALLLVGSMTYADEVSQNADQGQAPAAVTQTHSQVNQPTVVNQETDQAEINQQEQNSTAPEEISQIQGATENQEQATDSSQESLNQAPEESHSQQTPAAEAEADTATVTESKSQEGRDNPDISTEEYEANVSNLKQVTMADVYHMFDDQNGSYTLYLGRSTCIYCRKFSSVIKDFNNLSGGQVYYYNTDSADFSSASKEFLRSKIGTFGTPTVLHLEKGEIVSGQLGSGGTAQDLYNKVFQPADTATNNSQDAISSQQSHNIGSAIEKAEQPTHPDTDTTPDDISLKISDQLQTKERVKSKKEKLDINTLTKIINKALLLFDRLLVKFEA